MHKAKFLSIASALALLASAHTAKAATATATVNANITHPVQLTGGGTMAFGTILTPSTATYSGTFTVAPTAAQTGTYCASGFTCSGSPAAALFNVQGTRTTSIGINIPLTVTLSLQSYTGGGATPSREAAWATTSSGAAGSSSQTL